MCDRCKSGDKFKALHPVTMMPERAIIVGCSRDSKRGCIIRLEFDDGNTIENTAHHFRRFLKLVEVGVSDKTNYNL